MSSTMKLAGKVAIVTGSGRGLGLAYARELGRPGCRRRRQRRRRGGGRRGRQPITAAAAAPSPSPPPSAATETAKPWWPRAVEHFGRLDILVTNAGVLRDKSLLKMTDEDFDLVINVHLRGTFTCVARGRRVLQGARRRRPHHHIGSPTGQRGNFGQTNYAAAKAGIVGMVRTWALEMERAGVTVNAVSRSPRPR